MDSKSLQLILQAVNASEVASIDTVQTLWSGYGKILRLRLLGGGMPSVIVKQISPPLDNADHPRGWDTDVSHQRKLRSYQVEAAWYREWSGRCEAGCRVPQCFLLDENSNGQLLVLEDLDAAGFPHRHHHLSDLGIRCCLNWLADFHATFLHERGDQPGWPAGLWEIGTYWHLATRPDEFAVMRAGPLKDSAAQIDRILRAARFQTLVHGDAKVANFCFGQGQAKVAAVDFQYVGGGCGMKDLAYFLGSCLSDAECESDHARWLGVYFDALAGSLQSRGAGFGFAAVEAEWRDLFAIAWADFHRFMLGWCPGHAKLTGFSESMVAKAVRVLG
ncbi:MAG: phosphotransferase [Rubripirellula sp.]